MKINSIRQVKNLKNKRVFVRVDLNVPIKNGRISDDYKIVSILPTIRHLVRYKAVVILATHLGRPNSKKDQQFSTKPIALRLSKYLGRKVLHVDDCIGEKVEKEIGTAREGQVILLENLRFYNEEKKNDSKFAKQLAKSADIYVNEAFAVSHRKHASISAIKKYLKSYAGLLLESEIVNLSKIFKPIKPLIAIIGGAKVETKTPLIKKLNKSAEKILIGGALANNFLKALGLEVGKSLVDDDSVKFAKKFKSSKLVLPIDVIVTNGSIKTLAKKKKIKIQVKNVHDVKKGDVILDIGPETMRFYSNFINKAATLIWNGPMGYFESDRFKHGTLTIARSVAIRSRGKMFGVAGGGETVEALKMTDMMNEVDWVSTGGGAMLTFLGGGKMPGFVSIVKK